MTAEVPQFNAGQQVWLALVSREWDSARWERRELLPLKRPNFVLSSAMSSTLGSWAADTRTITLSAKLLEGRRWHILVDTLRHEMAHQVVSELFALPGEAKHGEAFARACALLNTSPAATARPEELEQAAEEPRIVATIRKLLALSGSDNRHEAEVALARAQQLALKYNVTLGEEGTPRTYAHRLLDQPRKRWPRTTWPVLTICEQLHDVRYVSWSVDSGHKVVELTGTPENLDLAEYTYHYLVNTGEGLWRAYRREHGLTNNRAKLSFLMPLYSAFADKLLRQRTALIRTESALVHCRDPQVEVAYRTRHRRVTRRAQAPRQHFAEAGVAGAKAGAGLTINPGIANQKPKKGGIKGLLPS